MARALLERRSVRAFASEALTLAELAQLLWAAQGVTSAEGLRTVPSAGATYPLEIHVLAARVEGLPVASYCYQAQRHALVEVASGDRSPQLALAAFEQEWVADAPAVFLVAAVFARTTFRYGDRGNRYVHIEAGQAVQNLTLQAVELGLRSVTVGSFDDGAVEQALALPRGVEPLVLVPVGHGRASPRGSAA